MTCRRCGNCCRLLTLPLAHGFYLLKDGWCSLTLAETPDPLVSQFLRARGVEVKGQEARLRPSGKVKREGKTLVIEHTCPQLSGNDCRLHENKPIVCRFYPIGEPLEGCAYGVRKVSPSPSSQG